MNTAEYTALLQRRVIEKADCEEKDAYARRILASAKAVIPAVPSYLSGVFGYDEKGWAVCAHSDSDHCYGCGRPAEDIFALEEWLCRDCGAELYSVTVGELDLQEATS
jgi:hypothetical protein